MLCFHQPEMVLGESLPLAAPCLRGINWDLFPSGIGCPFEIVPKSPYWTEFSVWMRSVKAFGQRFDPKLSLRVVEGSLAHRFFDRNPTYKDVNFP